MHLELTRGIDVALLVFYAFVLFFVCLVFYLRREDRREGYPLEDAVSGRLLSPGGALHTATAKSFLLPFDHGVVMTPTKPREPVDIAARRVARFPGAPYAPIGDPLADGIGPAAWANRAKRPDLDMDGHPRIVPLSLAAGYSTSGKDPDLAGWPVVGADGRVAGNVTDLWIDKADRLVRYIQLSGEGGPLLAPMMMAKVDRRRGRVVIDALNADQFAGAPRLGAGDRITLYEEERVQAYFGGGYLYANVARQGAVAVSEYEHEPIPGLPGLLPAGERILWQSSPDGRALARQAFHTRLVAGYFALLFAWALVEAMRGAATPLGAAMTLGAGVTGVALLHLLGWMSARTTIYTLTNRRIVMRIGMAVPKCINLPLTEIRSADLALNEDGSGDIPLTLAGTPKLGYVALWPHARPWRIARPQPMLRCVPEGERIARLIARTCLAANPDGRIAVTQAAPQPVSIVPEAAAA